MYVCICVCVRNISQTILCQAYIQTFATALPGPVYVCIYRYMYVFMVIGSNYIMSNIYTHIRDSAPGAYALYVCERNTGVYVCMYVCMCVCVCVCKKHKSNYFMSSIYTHIRDSTPAAHSLALLLSNLRVSSACGRGSCILKKLVD